MTEEQRQEEQNFNLFRDILSDPIVQKCSTTSSSKTKSKVRKARAGRKTAIKPVIKDVDPDEQNQNDAEELGEFIDYLATEIFTSLPVDLRTLTYSRYLNTLSLSPSFTSLYTPPLSPISPVFNALPLTIHETLQTYSLLSSSQTVPEFLAPVMSTYISTLIAAPPPPSQTKSLVEGCETCERDWIPLTYHHLIPKSAHARVIKRGWHPEDQLNNVAWLCRACHSFVHRIASAEELAKDFYTVERLMDREDVQAFAKWVGGVRWKSR